MKKVLKYIGRIFLSVAVLIFIWALWNRDLVSYGWMQFKGQTHIIYNARPIAEVLDDPSTADSVKARIKLIQSIRDFAIHSLGLKASKNYSTFYDQHSKPLLWVITASEPYLLRAYNWKFPIVGEVSYKGFFDKERGLFEDSLLKIRGFDTDFGEVSAWSTLGWFNDPILSSMLNRSDGSLAELIIHEMTHSTLYIKSDVNFNENLASAVGEAGALQFLKHHFGADSPELKAYIFRKEDTELFTKQMLLATEQLDTLYKRIAGLEEDLKYKFKYDRIQDIVSSLDTVPFHSPERYAGMFENKLPNNAYFLSFIRYDSQKAEMREELKNVFNDNIANYLDAVRLRYK